MQVVGFAIGGSLTGYVDTDVLVGPFPEAQDVTQFSPNLGRTPDAGGSLAVSLRNAADGGGDALSVTFSPGDYNKSTTGTVSISEGGYVYIRITAESGDPLDLGGIFVTTASAPTVDISDEPLTVGEVKLHLQIPTANTSHDSDLENLIARTREEAEKICGIPIVNQTKTMTLDAWPSGDGDLGWWDGVRDGHISAAEARAIELIPGNLQSVSALTTYDDSDNATIMSSANYFADTTNNRIVLREGQTWPYVARVANGIIITLQMGWATPSAVPGDLKERMKERIKQRWDARKNDVPDPGIASSFYGVWVRKRIGRLNP